MEPIVYRYGGKVRPKQRGVVLFIALIAMLILTLAGISLMRVVDTSMTLAGNLAYRQTALAATDQGVNAAIGWLVQQPAANLLNNIPGSGYSAVVIPEPGNWTDGANWVAGQTVTFNGPNGNVISYRIFRLCTGQGAINLPGQSCNTGLAPAGMGGGANSKSADAVQYQGSIELYYRVVVRAVGPRNSTAYVQVMVSRGT